jgi:cation:H+ antiporter
MLAATVAIALVVQGTYSRIEGAFLLAAMVGLVAWSVVDARRSRPDDPLATDTDEFLEDGAPRIGREVGRTVLGLAGTLAASQAVLTGALRLADELGLAAGFVGATIVALGTSLPELVTVVQSARRSEPDLIVGNLVGSNLFNALGVGGLAGIVGNAAVSDPAVTTRAVIAMLVVTGLAAAALVSGRRVTRGEAVVLLVAYVATVVVLGV